MKMRKLLLTMFLGMALFMQAIPTAFALPDLPKGVTVSGLNWAHQYYYPDYYSSFSVTLDDSFKDTWLYDISDNGKLFLEYANYFPSSHTSYYADELFIVNEKYFFGGHVSDLDYKNSVLKRGISRHDCFLKEMYTWVSDYSSPDGLLNPRTVEMQEYSRRRDGAEHLYIKRNITNGVKSISLWMEDEYRSVVSGYAPETSSTNVINVDMSTYTERFWVEDEMIEGEDITDYDHTEKYIEYVETVLFRMDQKGFSETGVVNIEGKEYPLSDAEAIKVRFNDKYPKMFYERPYLVPRSELVAHIWEGLDENELVENGSYVKNSVKYTITALDAVMKTAAYKSTYLGEMEFDAIGCGKEWVDDLSYYGKLNFHIYFFEVEQTRKDGKISKTKKQYLRVRGDDGEKWFRCVEIEAGKLPPGFYDADAHVKDSMTAFMKFKDLNEFSPEYISYDSKDNVTIELYLNFTDNTKSGVDNIKFAGDAIGNVTRIDYENAKHIFQYESCYEKEQKKELQKKMYEMAEALPKPEFYNIEENEVQEEEKEQIKEENPEEKAEEKIPDEKEDKPKPEKITVYINGEKVHFDQDPIIKENRTLVPMRAIFEALGAEVKWNEEERTVTAIKDGTVITIKIENLNMIKNGEIIELDSAPTIVNSRTLVPVRAVAESFGNEVSWNEAEMRVDVE